MTKRNDPASAWAAIWPVLNRKYPRTKTYLDHSNAWELLIAVILSAQTTDEGVNKVTKDLFRKYPDPASLARAKIGDVAKAIRSVNYFNAKARYIRETSGMILETFGGNVPLDEESLRTLPGVGRKTAVVVLSHIGDRNFGIPVDTHVIRFAHRFGLSSSNNPDRIEQDLQSIIPRKNWKRAAYAIKDYGRKEGRARGYDPDADPLVQALVKKGLR